MTTIARDIVREKLGRIRGAFLVVALFSCVVNVLMLTGPMFMLQVYDRILASQSVPTLVALLGLAVGLYLMMGFFDFLRTRTLSRAAHWLENELTPLAYRSWMVRSLSGYRPGYRPLQDLSAIRGFLGSPISLALFDFPWFPIYLSVVFLLHFQLGLLATAGAAVIVTIALLNEILSARPMREAAGLDQSEGRFAELNQKGADSVLAMGMLAHTQQAWRDLRSAAIFSQQRSSERSEFFGALSKSFRLLLQSAILALGAYLAIQQEISPGMIVAASIIAGRALAPMDQLVGGWRNIKRTHLAHKRLSDYLSRDAEAEPVTVELPEPTGRIAVVGATKFPPGSRNPADTKPILRDINFTLEPGDGLGVIGPSASGKSTLARMLVGLWMPDQGEVRIDGATFEQWDTDKIGRHIGYLPQSVELLAGSIAQNIARFEPDPDQRELVDAAKLAGVHDMILGLPDGYATDVDSAVTPLTGGQKQRIALARAVYRKPCLVVLDEPNSNLDAEGDAALASAILALRENGSVVVVMAHRPSAIAAVDKVLMLRNGEQMEFGRKEDVIRKFTKAV